MSGQWSPVAAKHRRMMLIRRIVILAVLLVALGAAAFFWPKPSPGGLTVATTASVGPAGVLQGTVSAVRSGGRACYSVRAADGTTAVLRFVPDWSADTMLGLRDASGLVVAQPGDTIVLLGRPGTVGAVDGCTQRGRIWTVTSIRSRS